MRFLAFTAVLLTFWVMLSGGCDPQNAQAAAAAALTSAQQTLQQLQTLQAALDPADMRRAQLQNAIDSQNKTIAQLTGQQLKAASDLQTVDDVGKQGIVALGTVGAVLPVGAGVLGLVGAAAGVAQTIAKGRIASKLDDQTTATNTVTAQAAALVHSFEAAKSAPGTGPAFTAALAQSAPLIKQIQLQTPGTEQLVNTVQDERSAIGA